MGKSGNQWWGKVGENGSRGLCRAQRSTDFLTFPNISQRSFPHVAPATKEKVWIKLFFYMFPNLYLWNVDIRKEIRGTVTIITQERVAVEVTLLNEVSLGVLYFEKPKQTWVNKPIMPTKWRCVDANVEGVFQWGGENITPKQLVEWAQELVQQKLKDESEH